MLKTRKARQRRIAAPTAEALESRALLTTFTVTSLADAVADDGELTLREAIDAAHADQSSSRHEIVFASGLNGTINLQLGELNVNRYGMPSLRIIGNGRSNTVIDAQGSSDIFSTPYSNRALSLRSMTLINSAGNGIENTNDYSFLSLSDTVVTGSGGHGVFGSIYSEEGYLYTDLSIQNSVITGNTDRGIFVEGAVNADVSSSVISQNSGGISTGRYGVFPPQVTIDRSSILNNVTTDSGGGISVGPGYLVVQDSLISGNEASSGGGIAGGAQVLRTTITGNTASGDGGGIRGAAELHNVTISDNTATRGGGIFFPGDHGNVANSTITGNTASGSGGGIFLNAGYQHSFLPAAFLASSIVAGNTATNNGADIRQTSTSTATFTNNFVGSNEGNSLVATGLTSDPDGNFVGTPQTLLDPKLDSATTIGLQTVFRPQSDSPVIGKGANPLDLATDQVGLTRSFEGGVDIGAAEFTSSAMVVGSASVIEGDSGAQLLVFNVTLIQPTPAFTVDVVTSSGTAIEGDDFAAHSDTLSFTGTMGETQQTTVMVNGDADLEFNETVLLQFENISETSVGLPRDAIGMILNDDTSNSIHFEGKRLVIKGTQDADILDVALKDGFIDVVLNGGGGSFDPANISKLDISTGAANDIITIMDLAEPSTIRAGNGDDTVRSGPGKNWIYGGSGNDTLSGGDARDVIFGEAGDDSILGNSGDDVLRGGNGADSLRGNAGDDLAYGDGGDDLIEGQTGNDTIRGEGGNDSIRGGGGDDLLGGGGGSDSISGGGGQDLVSGQNGADLLSGGSGEDYINAGQGPDTLSGGTEDDTLLGREGNDVLLGEGGDDSLVGLTGRDILYGGSGQDTLEGRASGDILIGSLITPPEGTTARELLTGGIRSEWLSGRDYGSRVANITGRTGQGSNRLNSHFLVGSNRSGQNVTDDGVPDELLGGSGSLLDLFFARIDDDLFDRTDAESLESV